MKKEHPAPQLIYPAQPPSGGSHLQEGAVRDKYDRSTEASNPWRN